MTTSIAQAELTEQISAEPAPPMPKARLGHISIVAQNPAAMAAFYQDMFGLQVVGGGANGAAVFLASYPEEESHDIVFGRDPALAHLAFKVETLADLQAAYRGLLARGLPVITQNHGVSLAAYFRDPEGNLIELYWPTGRIDFYLPVIRPLDLDLPEKELQRIVRELPSNKRAGAA